MTPHTYRLIFNLNRLFDGEPGCRLSSDNETPAWFARDDLISVAFSTILMKNINNSILLLTIKSLKEPPFYPLSDSF
jgi:hypothetical protein